MSESAATDAAEARAETGAAEADCGAPALNAARVLRVVVILVALDIGLGVLYVSNHALDSPFQKLNAFVDLDGESNLPTWYSSTQLLVLAGLLGVFALRNVIRDRPSSWLLLALPVVFAVLSLDEVAEIHEKIGEASDRLLPDGNRTTTIFPETGFWAFFVAIPFLALLLALIHGLRPYLRATPAVTRKLLAGAVIYVMAAGGADLVRNFSSEGSWASTLGFSAEEVGEMVGVTILIWASLELLQSHRLRIDLDPVRVGAPTNPQRSAR